jgi:phosphate-selective porin OprO/OprP
MTRSARAWLAALFVAVSPAVAADPPASVLDPVTWVKPGESPPEPASPLKPTFELRGRIEADALFSAQSSQSAALLGDFPSAYGFRRARLGAQGTVGTSARWVAEFEFAASSLRFADVFVGLTALPGVDELRVGYLREPFSLEGGTSSRFITFMERSPLNALDPTRNWGIAGFWRLQEQRVLVAAGAFRDGSSGVGSGTGDNWAATARLTGLPVYEPDNDAFRLVHVGGALSMRSPAGGVVSYNPGPQTPLLAVTDNPASPFLPAVAIPANSQQVYNLQAATVRGPLSAQGEWFATTIQQRSGEVVFFHGFYADVAYFLTGEHRGYDTRSGEFDRVTVLRPVVRSDGTVTGTGAVEVAARFSVADFESANLPPTQPPAASPTGAVLYQATFGANWYLNDFTRVMANYTLAVPVSPGLPASAVHVLGIRFAIFW